jgi:hypothetical protein
LPHIRKIAALGDCNRRAALLISRASQTQTLLTLMAKKTLNIGLVGYGFMGRTHAHAYHNAAQFFDLPLTPVLKAVCGRDGAKAKAFADNWGATT